MGRRKDAKPRARKRASKATSSPPKQRPPSAPPPPKDPSPSEENAAALNGFGVADAIVSPIYEAAHRFMEHFAEPSDVPPKLVPFVGKPSRRIRTQRTTILKHLGRHERFTSAALELFQGIYGDRVEAYEGFPVDVIIEHLDDVPDDIGMVACALIAGGRLAEARTVVEWSADNGSSDTDDAAFGSEDDAESQVLLQELKQERRRRERVTRRLHRALEERQQARRDLGQSRDSQRRAEARAADEEERCSAADRRIEDLDAQLTDARRTHRDLKVELEALQERFQRTRRTLKETRLVPHVEPQESTPKAAPAVVPPTASELRRRMKEEGPKTLFDTEQLWVIVDGYNVALDLHVVPDLPSVRRRLEQALQTYQSRTHNDVTVVWDGAKVEWFAPRISRLTIERVFTKDQIADDYIIEELEIGRPGVAPVIVTSDYGLRQRAQMQGATVVGSAEFLSTVRT